MKCHLVVIGLIAMTILVEASGDDAHKKLVRPKRTLHLLQAVLNAFGPPAKVPAAPAAPLPKAQPKMDQPAKSPQPAIKRPPPPPSVAPADQTSFFSNFPSFGFAKFNFFVTPFNTFPPQPAAAPAPPGPPASAAPPAPADPPAPPAAPTKPAPGPSKFAIPIPRTKPTVAPTPAPAPTEPQSTIPPPPETTLVPSDAKNDANASVDDADASTEDTKDNSFVPSISWRSSLFDAAADGPITDDTTRYTGGFFGDTNKQFLFDENNENFYNPPELQFRRAAGPHHLRAPSPPLQHQQQPQQSSYYHQVRGNDFGRSGAAQSSVKMHDNNFNYITYHSGPATTNAADHLAHQQQGVQTQYFGKRSAIY